MITLAELYEGVYGSRDPERHLQGLQQILGLLSVIGLDDAICRTFGHYRHRLRQQGQLIDNFDLLIGATCLTHQLSLITSNVRHYARIPELRIVPFVQTAPPQ